MSSFVLYTCVPMETIVMTMSLSDYDKIFFSLLETIKATDA
ncbi:hypothetical protein A0J61_11135 [Choanephora cucurbitarum]|uniref:Uncharacterized protein n=1 Tax=Choanephora cucurbitarum TaxID=101091 RepID=A0A1C7MVM8_9FUNG|nr:hypothetical protein A0J61_11135 [Choanephora cucurbitarum]